MVKNQKTRGRAKKSRSKTGFSKYRFTNFSRLAVFLVVFATVGVLFLYNSFAATNSATVSGAGYYGMSRGGLQWLTDQSRQAKLNDMQTLGVHWLRIDITWSDVQDGGPNSYNWAPFDRLVNEAHDRGISLLADITYTPRWALPAGVPVPIDAAHKVTWEHYAPNNPQDYANFAKKVAVRYAGRVDYFEIWNEANNFDFFKPVPSASKYVSMLRRSYAGIKAGNSNAIVITSGLSPYGQPGQIAGYGSVINPVTFLQQLYQNGAKGSFDAVGWHPYNWSSGGPNQQVPWNAWFQMYGTSPSALSVMNSNGDGKKKIWMTEWGYPSLKVAPSLTDETAQADYLSKGYRLARTYPWAGPLFWFTYDDGSSGGGPIFDSFGLVRTNNSHKPSYTAYKNLAK